MVTVNRLHIQSDLLEKSSHLKYVGIIIINTGITINVQLNSARVTTRSNDKRLVFELLEELSKSRAVANATEMAPAVAVINPSIRNVPSDRDVKASAEAGASKKNTVFLEVCGNTTSHTAANAYPRTAINKTHINEWLVQSDSSLALESLPRATGDPELKNMESVWGNNGEPISIKSRWPFLAIS
jgi:hypothetical protein